MCVCIYVYIYVYVLEKMLMDRVERQQSKLLLRMLASHMTVPVQVLAVPRSIQLPVIVTRKAVEMAQILGSVPPIPVGDQKLLNVAASKGINKQMEEIFIFASVTLPFN